MLLQRNALHIESRTRLVVWVRMMPKIGKISGWTVTAEIGWEPSNRVSELRKRSVWTACQIISNVRCGASRWLMLIVRSLHLGTAYFQLHPFDVAGRSPKSPTNWYYCIRQIPRQQSSTKYVRMYMSCVVYGGHGTNNKFSLGLVRDDLQTIQFFENVVKLVFHNF